MSRPLCAAALLAAFALDCATAAALRSRSNATALRRDEPIEGVDEIHAKWDKMDDFLEIMFSLACKWKHGKDVNGLAAEKLKDGELGREEVVEFKRQTQADNVQMLKTACGKITASGKGKCRQACANRWGTAMGDRNKCDGKCVTVYDTFDTSCLEKAGHLEMVYETKMKKAAANKQCYEGHCKEFPSVWMKEDEAAQKAEVDKQCADRCTADKIKTKCERKWQLEVDFVRTSVRSKCHGETKVGECFDKKKATLSTDRETCGSTGDGKCDTQYTKCKSEGKTDSTFKEAGQFCDDRLKVCKAQVVEHCEEDYRKAMKTAQDECEGDAADDLDACEAKKLKKMEADEEKTCIDEKTPTCNSDCQGSCDVAAMTKCFDNLKDEHDPAGEFCKDFWRLLHETSAVDPMTGDPIV